MRALAAPLLITFERHTAFEPVEVLENRRLKKHPSQRAYTAMRGLRPLQTACGRYQPCVGNLSSDLPPINPMTCHDIQGLSQVFTRGCQHK